MTLQTPDGRRDFLFDVSRWNRAGLSRFQYVDGDAAVWLEELRIAMMGLYLRGINPSDRVPERWRDVFLKPEAEHQFETDRAEFDAAVAWRNVWTAFPVEVETRSKRNQRLLEQYERESSDHAWEIMRAFARAAHIVLGYQDAYANEGYLRTATQWENLRKLAAMVNYQPRPPASATSTVALEIEPGTGTIEIARGLEMKYAPPEGGAPLIFETLRPVVVHPELSGARTENWNHNQSPPDLRNGWWLVPENARLARGDVVVVLRDNEGSAKTLDNIERDEERKQARLTFHPTFNDPDKSEIGKIALLTEPDGVQVGLPQTVGKQIVVKLKTAGSYSVGAIVEVKDTVGGPGVRAVVVEGAKRLLTLAIPEEKSFSGDVTVEAYTPFEVDASGEFQTPTRIRRVYYKGDEGSVVSARWDRSHKVVAPIKPEDVVEGGPTTKKVTIARIHVMPEGVSGRAYARFPGRVDPGKVVVTPSVSTTGTQTRTVRFEGKPPKSLKQDAWYVARTLATSDLQALQVSAVRVEAEVYFVEFNEEPTGDPDKTEFFGPMTQVFRLAEHNRDQRAAIAGGVARLEGLSAAAQPLVKVGRHVIVAYEKGDDRRAALAVLTSVELLDELDKNNNKIVKLTMKVEEDLSAWQAGWTKLHLNTVDISHGQTKDPKILGSGNAEKRRQSFRFKTSDVSFVPSSVSGTGVAPDMDVTVDGIKWEFRDLGDQKAEERDAWSVALNDDNTLEIHFRRRLPTGTNNVAVVRHRTGVGAKGTGIPSWSFAKPMKKNRFVARIVQPFTTAGGADRESVSEIRKNAPSNLAANGRAVSLKDFGQLCIRHSSVWQARAREVIGPGVTNVVDVVVVPAKGGNVGSTLERDLIGFIKSRALPNTRVTITNYQSLAVRMRVTVKVDTRRYERSDVKDAVEAGLFAEFALINRALGQPIYVGEIYAAAERVDGVSSVTITDFSTKSEQPNPLRRAEMGESLVALFPTEVQVAVLNSVADVTVDVEELG